MPGTASISVQAEGGGQRNPGTSSLVEDMSVFLAPVTDPVLVYREGLPDTPDECLAVFQFVDGSPVLTSGRYAIEVLGLQVQARSATRDGAERLSRRAMERLQLVSKRTINGVLYYGITLTQPPMKLHIDQRNRHIYRFEVRVHKAPMKV